MPAMGVADLRQKSPNALSPTRHSHRNLLWGKLLPNITSEFSRIAITALEPQYSDFLYTYSILSKHNGTGLQIMINSLGEIIVDQTTGYSKEDAVLLLLGIKLGEDAECDGISLDDILDAEKEHAEVGCLKAKDAKEQAEAAYANAQAEKLSDEAIKTAFDDLEKANQKLSEANQSLIKTDQLITKAAQYRRDITDELAKKESALRRDESNRITINSFNQWVSEKYKLTPESKVTSEQPAQDKPWLIVDPRDPPTTSSWYTPARYFARQLIKENANLLHNRDALTKKVAKSLGDVGIYKRGDKEPPNPDTLKKALSNVKLG